MLLHVKAEGASALQVSLLGEIKLWRQADLKLREDNDELSRQLTMLGKQAKFPLSV